VEESDKDQLNLQEKIQVTERIRKLSNEGLAAVKNKLLSLLD
jgi:hypothetical protein